MPTVQVTDSWARVDSDLGLVDGTTYLLQAGAILQLSEGTALPTDADDALTISAGEDGRPLEKISYEKRSGVNLYAKAVGVSGGLTAVTGLG